MTQSLPARCEAGPHTPWQIVYYNEGENIAIHDARGQYRVCFMATPGDSPDAMERIEANAQQIVASPEMLNALRRVATNARFDWLGRDDCNAVRAAIARATGQSEATHG